MKFKKKFIFIFYFFTLTFSSFSSTFSDSEIALPPLENSSIVIGDYDNDADMDFAISGFNGPFPLTRIYENIDGNFDNIHSIILESLYKGNLEFGDYDLDGDLDLIVCGYNGTEGETLLYKNNSESFELSISTLQSVWLGNAIFGDYDNDGDLDIAVVGYNNIPSSDRYAIIYENKNATFSVFSSTTFSPLEEAKVAWADIDNDGDLDFAEMGMKGKTGSQYLVLEIYKNNGSGNFTISQSTFGLRQGTLKWVDFDNDGDLDLSIAGLFEVPTDTNVPKEKRFLIYKNNNGLLDFSNPIEPMGRNKGFDSGDISWGDFDNDGDLDVAVCGNKSLEINEPYTEIFENKLEVEIGSFTVLGSTVVADVYNGSIQWFDYDNDKDLDLIISGTNGSMRMTKIYKNNTTSKNTLPTPPNSFHSEFKLLKEGEKFGKLSLSWSGATDNETPYNGLYYNIYIATYSIKQYVDISTLTYKCVHSPEYGIPFTGNLLTHTTFAYFILKNDKKYYWAVQTIDTGFGSSSFSQERVHDTLYPPSAISNLTALPGTIDGEIILEWSAPGDDGTHGACFEYLLKYATYQITADLFDTALTYEQNWVPLQYGSSEQHAVTGLTPGVTYYFAIKGYDWASYGLWNSSLDVSGINTLNFSWAQDLVPSSPTWSRCISKDESIVLTWNKNPEIDIDKYFLEMSTYSSGGFSLILSTSSNSTVYKYTVTGLENFTTYYFRMKCSDWTGHISPYSEVKSNYPFDGTPPEKITDLKATTLSLPGQILLSWTSPGDNGLSDEIINGKYQISFATFSFSESEFALNFKIELSTNISPGNLENFIITGLENDTTYYFRIRTADEVLNWAEPSNLAIAKSPDVIAPSKVTNLTGMWGDTPGTIKLRWTSPGDNGTEGNITNGLFKIQYSTFDVLFSTNFAQITKATSTIALTEQLYTITDLIPGTTYFIHLWMSDEAMNWNELSNRTTAQAKPDLEPPDLQIISPLHNKSYGKLNEIRGVAIDDYGKVIKVELKIPKLSDTWYLTSSTNSADTTWYLDVSTFTFSSGNYYTINVRAEDSYGNINKVFTVNKSSITIYFDNTPPQRITTLSASTGGNPGEIVLNWIAPNDLHSAVESYMLKYSSYFISDATSWWEDAQTKQTSTPKSPGEIETITVDNLIPGITYWFNIRSIDSVDYYHSTSTFSNFAFAVAKKAFKIAEAKPKRKIFTPNRDGKNDYIEFTGLQQPFKIEIFTISGEKVREITDVPRWNGKDDKGKILPSGIYVYIIEKDGKKEKGFIVLAK